MKDKIRGSLIGGAIGDALGYPVEFMFSIREIRRNYGEQGITRLDTRQSWKYDPSVAKAEISDDTQMTLFTAMGMLNACRLNIDYNNAICRAYLEWYATQTGKTLNNPECWIFSEKLLHVRRAPGNTCMSALFDILNGQKPNNDSKGCGGVMRVAPVALYAAVNNRMSIENADRLAGDAAEITHLHPLGFIPAALMSHVIYRLLLDEQPSAQNLENYIHEGLDTLRDIYGQYSASIDELQQMTENAIKAANNGGDDVENIEALGGGWTGDEALVIAFYCALKYFDNIEMALVASVNHAGDSDSTGAVTGNILGAAVGYNAIPQHFKDDVELHDLILRVADELYDGEA